MLVLNASYEPINVCTVRRATVCCSSRAPRCSSSGEGALHSERLELDRPCVIRLHRYVRIPRDVHRRKITRKAVLARDAYTCQYCGREAPSLTVDHVIPRSRGGESVWENIVASCAPCNRKKGNRLPREARCTLRPGRARPGPTVFIRIASPRVPLAWEPYLAPSGSRGCRGCLTRSSRVAGRIRKAKGRPRGDGPSKVRFRAIAESTAGGTGPDPRFSPVPGVGFRQAARTLPARDDGHPPPERGGRLAAPHLQGPERTITQRRTTSFLW